MNYNKTSFPIQMLPASKKTKEWMEACIDYVISTGEVVSGGMTRTRFEELQIYYNLYNGIFDEKDLKHVTNPFKVDDGFPATPQDYNIIKPKIDVLLGEETKRPFNFVVARTSQIAAGELQEKSKAMLMDYLMAMVISKLSEEDRVDFEEKIKSGEIMTPDSIQKYVTKDYKDLGELVAYHVLKYLRNYLALDHEFFKGWKDGTIAGEEIYYVGVLNGEPYLERVNPLFFSYDKSPDLEFIEDGDWACRRMRLAYTEVYDRLYDKMDPETLRKLLDIIDGKPGAYGADKNMIDDFNKYSVRIVDNPTYDFRARNTVNVWHAVWKSYKKVYFIEYCAEDGSCVKDIVDESYIKTGEELSITEDWILEVWEGYRIGNDLYVGCGPIEYQHVSIDNPNSQKLPYTGVVYSNTNSVSKSLVSTLKPLQYMNIVLWYRLELALARDKGKVVNMDITQIPKSMNITPERWMHYLSAIGVNFINPYEEGWDIPGREGGKPAAFNQITAIDLSMANVISQYISLLDKVDQMTSAITGITPTREGHVTASQLVGNVQQSISASNNVTEPLYWIHNQCKKRALQLLLNTAKAIWKQSGKKKLHYIFDDATRAFIDLTDDFYNSDFDIFVTDSSKELQNIEKLQQFLQPAMQNGASLLDIVEILTNDNFNIIKQKLQELDNKKQEQDKQQAQAENDAKLQQLQAANQYKELELSIKQQELELQKYKIDTDAETRLAVAEIGAYGFAASEGDQTSDDIANAANYALKDRELASKEMDAQLKNSNKTLEINHKARLETNKLEIERQKANKHFELETKKLEFESKKLKAEKDLQILKDSAAMRREQLKSTTALKNKTTGEN